MKVLVRMACAICVCLAMVSNLNAQFTIGENNGSNGATVYPTPIFDYFKTMKSQYLYLASEMTGAGMTAGFIDEISWNVTAIPAGTGTTEDYTIKLLGTATTSLSTTGWEEGASLVYGPVDYDPVIGSNTFILDDPYYWNGVDNIIIEICGGDDNIEYTKNARVSWTGPLPFNASRTYVSDTDTDPCAYLGGEFEDAVTGGYDYRPRVTFGLLEAVNCSDLPLIGATNASSTEVCEGELFSLSVGAVPELGISYSWFTSLDGISWSLIPGITSASFVTTQSIARYYRCTVTCDISGDNSNSIPVYVTMKPETECYCQPSYVLGTQEGDYISNVELGDINNPTGASTSPYYTYYTALSTEIVTGQTYSIDITCGEYELNNGVAAWIDFNRNGNFETSEKLGESTGLGAFATATFTFLVPASAVEGTARLRVRDVYNTGGIDPCLGYDYGETEDYNVEIVAGNLPEANFTYSGDPTVTFTDLTLYDPISWYWTFGDGFTSTEQNPVHTYATNSTYNVCLTATSLLGSDIYCTSVPVTSYVLPVAEFSYSGDPTVTFTDLSINEPTAWNWNFGDGFTSTEQDPVHTYAADGVYNVCLTASNVIGSNIYCEFINITGNPEVPVADFTYSGDPTFDFIDASLNEPTSWHWDFGDGFTADVQNTSHTYAINGTYTVCLTAGNLAGANEYCENIVVSGYPAPVADFSFTGDPTVDFTDLSLNDPTSWFWDFADGGFSADQNPTHTFAANGIYNVCLTVNAAGGLNTDCQDVTIAYYGSAPDADFSYEVSGLTLTFTDLSANAPDDWFWDFGDGDVSGIQNPIHTYDETGDYTVCLTATNVWGTSSANCKTVTAVGILDQPSDLLTLQLFPNPAQHNVHVVLPSAAPVQVFVFDAVGQAVAAAYQQVGTLVTLDVAHLPAGTYRVMATNGDDTSVGVFVKD